MRPVLFEFLGISLYSYPLFAGLGLGLFFRLSRALLLERRASLSGLGGLFAGLFVCGLLGAKLLFVAVLALSPHKAAAMEMAQNPSFWLGGGLVFYGGLLGGGLFAALYVLLWRRFSVKNLACLLPGLAFGHALGRVGCFLAGCCYGGPTELPWGVVLKGASRHPVQFYEAAALVALGFFLLSKVRREHWAFRHLLAFYLASYSLLRFVLEYFRGDSARGVWAFGISTSQGIALVLLFCTVLWWLRSSPPSESGNLA